MTLVKTEKRILFIYLFIYLILTLGRARKVIPPPWVQGGKVDGISPLVFDMLKYFETILPSV